MTDDDLAAAWNEVHASPPDWYVGKRAYEPRRAVAWSMYAFDTTERAKAGYRSREWTATAMTEKGVVRAMARCLRELREGRAPK